MKLEFYQNYYDIDKNVVLFELNINSNFNFGDDNENALMKDYFPLNIETLFELYFESYYKIEMQNHLIELCIGILAYNVKSSDDKTENDNYLDPYIKHDLFLLNKDDNFKLTINS
ncbi:MAG TPA: hypothetical protein VFP49_03715 [Nitrososphaeraceae archaeon]|nr:hypothetical protein [Nitrososphaeraceae archaeon]